jgi:hypothetical protein
LALTNISLEIGLTFFMPRAVADGSGLNEQELNDGRTKSSSRRQEAKSENHEEERRNAIGEAKENGGKITAMQKTTASRRVYPGASAI